MASSTREDPETLESEVLFSFYVDNPLSSPFFCGDSHVVFASSTICDCESEWDDSGSVLDVEEDVVQAGAVGDVELGLEIDSDRRESAPESVESRTVEEVTMQCSGLRLVSIDSDSDSEYLESENLNSSDFESRRNGLEELEWEEVSERLDDRVEDMTVSSDGFTEEFGGEEDAVMRNLEWEFLLAVNNMHRNLVLDSDPYVAAPDDFFYAAESDLSFDQFIESEIAIRGNPPAAREAVKNLPSVCMKEEDVERCGGVCVVCKEEVSVGDILRKLPCLHYYHGECILPWLEIRNSCPVCRYELPTDDSEYEQSRSRGGGWTLTWELPDSEDFEPFA